MSQLLRVQCFNVSRDGFGAGVGQSLDHPFGHGANPADLFAWAGATASWVNRTDPGGSRGLDDYFTRDFTRNIGAEIMGRNKFGPQRGPWENDDWKGWWGDMPPFHTPVFVLTHHERPSFTLSDTTFHFLDATPAEALRQAKQAANGKDVRSVAASQPSASSSKRTSSTRCTSPSRRSSSAAANGSGTHTSELLDRFHLDAVPSPSGVAHLAVLAPLTARRLRRL